MSTVMTLHSIIGIASVGFGVGALLSRKGSFIHRLAGQFFLGAVLIVLALTAIEAIQSPGNIRSMGLLFLVFVGYLVFTSWLAITNRSAQASLKDYAALVVVLIVTAGSCFLSYNALVSTTATHQRLGAGPTLFLGTIALVAVFGDIRLIAKRGLPDRRRLARHIWRMGFALQMATAAMFTGPGTGLFPASMQGTVYSIIPELLVALVVMLWLTRYTVFSKWGRQ